MVKMVEDDGHVSNGESGGSFPWTIGGSKSAQDRIFSFSTTVLMTDGYISRKANRGQPGMWQGPVHLNAAIRIVFVEEESEDL